MLRIACIGLGLLVAVGCSAQIQPLTCLALQYDRRHSVFPEHLVLYPGADSGLVAVAASANRELRPNSRLRHATYWRLTRDSIAFVLGDSTGSQRYQMALTQAIAGNAVWRVPVRDLDTDSVLFWKSDTVRVRANPLPCGALPRGMPDTSALVRPNEEL